MSEAETDHSCSYLAQIPYIHALIGLPLLGRLDISCAMQDTRDATVRVVLGIERYRLQHQMLPTALAEVGPLLSDATVPQDPITRQPLEYVPNADGTYQLHGRHYTWCFPAGEKAVAQTR